MLRLWTTFQSVVVRDEEGAGLVEYVLLIALIAVFVIGAAMFLSGQIGAKFSQVGSTLSATS